MNQPELEDLGAIIPHLLKSLEVLEFISRHLNPQDFPALMDACGSPDADLGQHLSRLDLWPADLVGPKTALATASDHIVQAFQELRAAPDQADGLGGAYRALRHLPRAQEALYPLASGLPPVSRYFLDPPQRGDAHLLQQLAEAPARPDTGIAHVDNDPGSRGGYSLYVPETCDPAVALPLVMALHGGSGHGRGFIWSWLRDARTYGAILVAPTSVGRTWAISGDDPDTPNLARILGAVRARWTVDPDRLLLAGMSDGGTFAYVSGMEATSPFTHLAPTSAAFHPMLTQFADPERVAGLPIHITHGVLDWMFPVSMAREAQAALSGAGSRVVYREIDDLSHTYPRELNADILRWLNGIITGVPPA